VRFPVLVEDLEGAYPSPTLLIGGIDVATDASPPREIYCRFDLTHLRPDHYRLEPSRRFGSWVVDPTTRLIGQGRWHESARPFPYPDTKAHHITVRPRPTEPLPGSGRLAWEPGLHRGLMTAAWGCNVCQFLDDSPSPLVGLDSVSGYQVDAGPGLETAELREFW